MPLPKIEEIIRRSVQGVTRPFLCRDTDGRMFYVKGINGCGREALRAEMLASRIGHIFGLPIPFCTPLEIPSSLNLSAVPGVGELGGGLAFGSLVQNSSQEVTWPVLCKIPPLVKARVLLFDWLILNNDRLLTPMGGNPNMVCSGTASTLALIDHHAAFDRTFETSQMWSQHACQQERALWTPKFRDTEEKTLLTVAQHVKTFWSELPESWFEEDDRDSALSVLEHSRIDAILTRPQSQPDQFWNGKI